ncbi:cyclic nucleotide-binding domain-containing protein [Baaleninema simplex]|uniref:cyclic nucleotide-binding domain-containing protein n=1 Tax=Baaleninema simplex TaxID=2862350 RepID=UPI0003480BE2|nr:cyclic nucleotide-binding domain-containing protein [Baaleninema simplex]
MLDPSRTVEIFQKQPEPDSFTAGEVIFEDGQPGDVMYGIIEGTVELHIDGRPVEVIEKGDVFGEGALLYPHGTRASTAIANTDCTLAVMDRERFLFAIQTTPMFAIEIMHSLSVRLRRFKHPQYREEA